MDVSRYLKGDEPEAVWFDFRDGCRVCIRCLSPRILRALKKQATRREFAAGEVVEDFDEEFFHRMLAEEIIVDWSGFCDEKGEPVPCTPENRRLLMDNWTEFNLFVQNASVNLEKHHRRRREDELKN